MAEAIFNMKEGTEFPKSFAGAAIRHFSPDKPKDENDWDGLVAQLRQCYTDAFSAHAGITASYNLDRQKGIKAAAAETIGEDENKRHRTIAELQDWALATEQQKIKRRLRDGTPGEKKASSGKVKIKAVKDDVAEQLAQPDLDPAVRAYLEARKARLEALGVEQAAETPAAAANVEPATSANTEPAPPKKGANRR
jgi:hypothetical protein